MRILRAILRALVAALGRLHYAVALLLLNLVVALVLAAPLHSLLSRELDRNLYGDAMATGASWRWFDTFERRHGEVLGDLHAWNALFGDRGVTLADLGRLSGTAAAVAVAGLALFWLSTLLHCGFLSTLSSPRKRGLHALAELARGSGRFALPGTFLAVLGLGGYAAVYALVFRGGGRLLEPLSRSTDHEWLALGLVWTRLLLTLLGLALVKIVFDLAKAHLVMRDGWNVPGALWSGLAELLRNGLRYLLAYLVVGLAGAALVAAWWWLPARLLETGTWAGLVTVFLLQQGFLTARIGVRLVHLGTTWELYQRG